ncbi:hypothetical protein K0M31_005433, partial [Melipona bicolor]
TNKTDRFFRDCFILLVLSRSSSDFVQSEGEKSRRYQFVTSVKCSNARSLMIQDANDCQHGSADKIDIAKSGVGLRAV